MRQLKKLVRCTSGALALETAMSLVITVPLIFSIFEIAMMSYTYTRLNDAARQGIRYAVTHGSDSSNCSGPSTGCSDTSAANVQAVVWRQANYSLHNLSAMTVNINYLDSSSAPGARVQVAVKYPYSPFIIYPAFMRTVNLSAEGRIVF